MNTIVEPFDIYSKEKTINLPPVLKAMYAYVAEFTDLDPNSIFQAYNNKSFLPQKGNDFAVITQISSKKIGSNVRSMTDENTIITSSHQQYRVQVDVYGNSYQSARNNMQSLYILFRDDIGASFFEEKNISPLYADEPRDFTSADSSKQYVFRFSCDFHLAGWEEISLQIQNFSHAETNIKNVDVAFPH